MKQLSALLLLAATAVTSAACGTDAATTDISSEASTTVPVSVASDAADDVASTTSPATPPTTTASKAATPKGAPSTTVPRASGEQPGETGAGEEDPSTAAGTVRAWAQALAERDTGRAWNLTHVASRDAFGGRKAFDAAAADLDARYGTWAEAPGVQYEATPLPAAGPAVTIVVLRGTVGGKPSALAVPVRQDADGVHQVDPFQDLLPEGHLEFDPEAGSTVSARQEFGVYLVGGRDVSLIVDDEVLRVTTESADGDRQHVTGRPSQALGAGSHTLTVVVERDGALQARAVRYRV